MGTAARIGYALCYLPEDIFSEVYQTLQAGPRTIGWLTRQAKAF